MFDLFFSINYSFYFSFFRYRHSGETAILLNKKLAFPHVDHEDISDIFRNETFVTRLMILKISSEMKPRRVLAGGGGERGRVN